MALRKGDAPGRYTLDTDLGDLSGIAFALTHLGRLTHIHGEGARAEALLHEGFQVAWQSGEMPMVTEAIEGLAEVTCDQGETARCARLLGVAQVLRETTGIPLPAVHEAAMTHCVTVARAALGEAGFAAALGEGRALTPEQLLPSLGAVGAS